MSATDPSTAQRTPEKRGFSRSASPWLWAVVTTTLAVHGACYALSKTWLVDSTFEHELLHTAAEVAGGLIALWVAYILFSLERRAAGTTYNVWIGGALIAMGILDILHAIVHDRQQFVWLHTAATFAGGLLFMAVILPKEWQRLVRPVWPWAVILGITTVGLLSILNPAFTPKMLAGAEFTWWAINLHLLGGLFFFAAATRLITTYWETKNVDDLLFGLHCAFFGGAAVLFESSEMWDLTWWEWHLLRLMAYAVALWFVMRTEADLQRSLDAMTKYLEDVTHGLRSRVEEMTQELRSKNADLERSNRDLQQFAYVASHDLQEPLRAVAGYCQLLDQELAETLEGDKRQYLRHAVEGAKRMQTLVDSLLEYSRVESRGRPMQPCKMQDAVEHAERMLQVAIQETDAVIEIGELPTVLADEEQIVRLFLNLLSNAIKFRGESQPSIQIRAKEENDEWLFSVTDRGVGFDPEHESRIFVIFQRLHTRQRYPGTGLGLALCKRIVERHGGTIWARSEPGSGSAFYFTLPKPPS